MAFPAVETVRVTDFASTSTTHNVVMPATVNAGDYLVCLIQLYEADFDVIQASTPANWNFLSHGSVAGEVGLTVFYKPAIGDEGDTSVNFATGTNTSGLAVVYSVSGASAIQVGTSATGASSTHPNPPSVTASWGSADNLWLAACATYDADGSISAYPTNYTGGRTDRGTVGEAYFGTATRQNATATEDPGVFTRTGAQPPWVAQTIVFKPFIITPVGSASHGHEADPAPAVIQPDEALHGHTVGKAPAVAAAESTVHAHSAGSPNTVFGHDAAHGHTADKAPAIAAVASCTHGHTADEAATDVVTPASALHGHTADRATATAAVESCSHAHTAGRTGVVIDVEDSVHLHTVDEATFAGPAPVQSCTHAHLARQAAIIGLLKFATEEVTARDVLPYPVTLVEIAKNPAALDTSNPRQGKYRGVVLSHPEISEEASESTFGIRTKRDVTLDISNAKRIFKVDGGTEYRGWTAQIWRLSGGVKELRYRGRLAGLSIGQTVGLRLKDEIRAALHDRVPHRFITTDEYPKARDVGKAISIASGRVPRIPCPNIEWDDAERIYRYALGEGEGYGGENWQGVTRAYRGDVAFKHLTGTVAGATSTTLTLQSADARPAGFLRWFWAEITSGTGAGQIRAVSAHTVENQVQVSPAWSVTPNGSSQYRLREWRFYDGGQASPYPGVAFLEFRKQILDGSSAAPVYADGEALPGETNFVRMIQSLLSNPVWGKGLQVAEGAFDRAAELPEMEALLCEGWRSEPEELVDILGDLMKARGIWLYS